MGFRFRRSVSIIPGVRLNFGTRGVSTTIGRRGASITFGKRGTYANVGLPGTGLSYRERLDLPSERVSSPRRRSGGAVIGVIAVAIAGWLLSILVS